MRKEFAVRGATSLFNSTPSFERAALSGETKEKSHNRTLEKRGY